MAERHRVPVLGIAGGADIAWGRPERERHGRADRLGHRLLHECHDEAGLAPCSATSRCTRPSGATASCSPASHGHRAGHHDRRRAAGAARRDTCCSVPAPRAGSLAGHRCPLPPDGCERRFRRLREAVDGRRRSHVRFGPVKLYADDVIEPHTAWMLDDYANRPGHRGHPSAPSASSPHRDRARPARLPDPHPRDGRRRNPSRPRRHRARRANQRHPRPTARHRARRMPAPRRPAPVRGARRDGRDAAPALLTRPRGGTWMDNVGEERWDRAWRFRSLLESGATWHSRATGRSVRWIRWSASTRPLTRAGLDGVTGGRLTSGSADRPSAATPGRRAGLARRRRTAARVGARADVAAWSDDLYRFEDDPAGLLEQRAQLTIVGGESCTPLVRSPIPSDMRSATTPPPASARCARTRTDVRQGAEFTSSTRIDPAYVTPATPRPRL